MAGMFTVCPKCALTLVVTAADLRVAQGYVRCGRCSNVFNALARLSENRNAVAAAAGQTPPPASSSDQHPRKPSTAAAPAPSQPSAPSGRSAQATAPLPPTPPDGGLPGDIDEEAIPEDALEFNPAAADVNQVFVEPPPNPEWTAATGTFKSIILRSEDPTPGAAASQAPSTPKQRSPDQSAHSGAHVTRASSDQTEIELDADFLSSTAEMRKLKISIGEPDNSARASSGASSSQAQFVPSAKPTPRAQPHTPPRTPLETQSQPRQRPVQPEKQPQARPRAPAADTQPQTQPKPSTAEQSPIPEPEVGFRGQPRKTIRAFGLDSVEPPPPQVPTSVARSRAAPAALELDSAAHLMRKLTGSPAFWRAGVAAMLVLLLVQVVNHYRNDLAATPQFNKPITALYAVFGVHLTPSWDLHAYDVRQLGASVDAESAGQIMVRASVKNGGRQAQPLPLLRVTLQDRFGNRIAARDVPPGNYLPPAIPPASFLSAGQRIDAEMAFVDPGSNAVGFEIDACLPAPAGGIACANDPVSR